MGKKEYILHIGVKLFVNIEQIKNCQKKLWKVHQQEYQFWYFLTTYPLVRFCPNLLDPPTPQKIGHHEWMFPKAKPEMGILKFQSLRNARQLTEDRAIAF